MDIAKRLKALILALCVGGASCVAYGMLRENDPVFLLGIVLLIAGYLVIRKGLKASIEGKGEASPDADR